MKWSNSVGQGTFMAPNAISGITHVATNHSVDATVEKLSAILQSSGITLFALVIVAKQRKQASKCLQHDCSSSAVPSPELPERKPRRALRQRFIAEPQSGPEPLS